MLGACTAPVLAADPSPSASPTAAPSGSPTAEPSASPDPSPTASPSSTASPSPATAWPTTVTALGSTVRFYGRGYGHGVGLNQYGARGRALGGQTAEQILAAYFRGATLSTTDAARPVRVLLMAGYRASSTSPLIVYGRNGTWAVSGWDKVLPAGARLLAWSTTSTTNGVSTTTWRAKVLGADGVTVLHAAVLAGRPVVSGVEPATVLQLLSKPSVYDTYRGTLTLGLGTSSLSVVNTLGLDAYLRGVVPVEMPSTWPAEALRAQAITARSYAVRHLHPTTGSFDVYDDTRSQVYRGLEAEVAAANAVIDAAPGSVLMYGSSVVNAVFSSTGGGATESNEYAFVGSGGKVGSPVAYLRGIVDRSDTGVAWDAAAPRYAWSSSTLTLAQLSAMFKADSRTNVGALQKLDLRRRGVSGRLYAVVLYGSAGVKTVSANVFRSVYNARRPAGTRPLYSNLFDSRPLP